MSTKPKNAAPSKNKSKGKGTESKNLPQTQKDQIRISVSKIDKKSY